MAGGSGPELWLVKDMVCLAGATSGFGDFGLRWAYSTTRATFGAFRQGPGFWVATQASSSVGTLGLDRSGLGRFTLKAEPGLSLSTGVVDSVNRGK